MKFNGHFEVIGEGPPVLCFSGFGCSNYLFKPMAECLKGAFRFILPDNRGMGKSPKVTAPYEIVDLAQDGLNLMDDLGFQSFHVIGISMGGFISEILYFSQPERVKKLALLCTMGPGPDFIPTIEISEEQLATLYKVPLEQRARIGVSMTTHPDFESSNQARFESLVQMRIRNPADLAQSMFQYHAVQRFMKEQLPFQDIHIPVLALCGADDRTVPPANSRIIGEKVQRGQVMTVAKTDHLFFLEAQEESARLIENFLSN